jgi:hypothetical protein
LKLLKTILVLIFLAGTGTAMLYRDTGYNTVTENGKYYLAFKSSCFETTAEEYNRISADNLVRECALLAALGPAGVWVIFESVNYPRGHALDRHRRGR